MSNIKTKTGAVVVGAVLSAAVLVAVALSPTLAFAQETNRKNSIDETQRLADRPFIAGEHPDHRPGLHFAKGSGIATNKTTGDNHRSGFVVLTQKLNSTEVNQHIVKRGVIAIWLDGKRIDYKMIPETWKIVVSKDKFTLQATGQVKSSDGKTFDVVLNGYFAIHSRLGNLWSIEGTMTGQGNISYELHYVATSHGPRPNTSDAPDQSEPGL